MRRQIWATLPSFCTAAADFAAAFPRLARRLGTTLEQDPDLRPVCCAALLAALSSLSAAADADADMDGGAAPGTLDREAARAGLAAVAGFAKNFLPLLFNACASAPAAQRPALLDTIRAYARVTDAPRLGTFFQARPHRPAPRRPPSRRSYPEAARPFPRTVIDHDERPLPRTAPRRQAQAPPGPCAPARRRVPAAAPPSPSRRARQAGLPPGVQYSWARRRVAAAAPLVHLLLR